MTPFLRVGIRRSILIVSLLPFVLFLSTCTSKRAETPPPPPPSPAVGFYSPEEARQRALSLAREALARGEREVARKSLARLLREYPASPAAGEALFLLGKAAFESRRYEEAIRHFSALRARFPLSPHFHESEYYLGLAHHGRGDFREAWPFLRQALSRTREPGRAARLEAALGDVYLHRKNPWGALEAYASALRRWPRAPWAGRVREALRRLVRRDLSEGELIRVAERFGRGEAAALARWELARRAKAAGRVKEAREQLENFIKDFPQHERA
ncbi:MAG: tol-pal system YbgF family protein, partial [Nitrospinota bacterium]